jgi:hypothetical protein
MWDFRGCDMKWIILALGLAATPLMAQTPTVVAAWGENSGSLPPEYAWDYQVEFLSDGTVQATYCKGYADEAPGCATVTRKLPVAAQKTMGDAIEPYAEELLDNPPKSVGDDEIPIGGGSIAGRILLDDTYVVLERFPIAADAERVQAVLQILQDNTPSNLVKKAKNRAKQP